MAKQNTSLICTVLNEEQTVSVFIESVIKQSTLPDELIIVDGGSADNTLKEIAQHAKQYASKLKIRFFIKKGNRSVGRNEAINKSRNDIILITDSGNLLDKNWVKRISEPFKDKKIDVVAGYYKGAYKTVFQKSLIPYVLVMEDRVDKENFLPATRSMAIRKSVWRRVGRFNEKLSHNEDYAFANKLKDVGVKIVFIKEALVNWKPRKNLKEAFIMFFRFALGDAESGIFRDKVIYLFLRYAVGFYLILLSLVMKSVFLYGFIILLFIGYVFWSIWKNYKYVRKFEAFIYLPLLQFSSDIAVILGTVIGLIGKISRDSIGGIVKNNKGEAIVIFFYISALLFTISYGIPNAAHPFDYFMDEWHQSQSVRALFSQGSPNVSGAANGSILQFFLTGIYLIPFYLLGIIDPFSIKSSVLNLDLQEALFEVLRLNTIIFGVFSIIIFSYIAKKYFKVQTFISSFLFTVNPLWTMLSGYFKYDIALIFWILVSTLFLLRYVREKRSIDFYLAGFFSALALSTKLSALPIFLIYVLVFILFTSNLFSKIKRLFIGVIIFALTFLLFGIPDLIFGKGSPVWYFVTNISSIPKETSSNLIIGQDYFSYLLLKNFPIEFGLGTYFLFFLSIFIGIIYFFRENKNLKRIIRENREYLLVFLIFIIFLLSLYPLKVTATGNRILVLLPFVALTVSIFLSKLLNYKNSKVRLLAILLILVSLVVQVFSTYSLFKLKVDHDPRNLSSEWIQENVKKGSLIGIENIPIYQELPDVVVKEFYLKQYAVDNKNIYNYEVINSKSKNLPQLVILTNEEIEFEYFVKSDKNEIFKRLKRESYKNIKSFKPNLKYFKILGNEFDFYMNGLILTPLSISIYEKQ